MRRITLCSSIILFGLATVGCGGAEAPVAAPEAGAPRRGGTAVLGSISDVDSWNEYLSRQSFAGNLLRRIYLRLAEEQGDARERPPSFAPLLAESWEFSADGRALTFRLRDASWSDGQPITAADVRFTWTAQTAAEVPWINAESKSGITDVTVDDARTVTFHFAAVHPFQLADAVEGGILPEHVFGRVPFAEWVNHDWSAAAVGSGPFALERHAPGHEIVLARNAHYLGEAPLLDRVVVRIVPDISNLLTQVRAGEIDYLEGVTPRDAHSLAADGDLTVVPFDYPSYDFIGWNNGRAPFDNPEVRRALTQAIDREALVEDLLYGYGEISKGPVLSFWWAADRSLEAWDYDPQAARATLERHGLAGDGGLEFELLTNSGNRLREDMLVKIQEQFARVGVRVKIRPLEMRTLRQQVGSGDFDGYLGGWVYSIGDLGSIFGSDQPGNTVAYRSAEIDAFLDRLEAAREWESMRADLAGLQRQIHQDQPYTFLYENRRLLVYGPRLGGVEVDIPEDPLARLERFWVR